MIKRHKIKIVVVLVILTVLIANKLFENYLHREMIKLRIDDFEKIEYDSVESLVVWFDTTDFDESIVDPDTSRLVKRYNYTSVINNVVYTITEDQIIDEFYEVIYSYNSETRLKEDAWLIYDLAINNQYCHYQRVNPRVCQVSETEIKSLERSNQDISKDWLRDLQVVKIESSTDKNYPILYETKISDHFLEAIDNAYIINQGVDTPGYDEAMKWSYDLAKSNGSEVDFEQFKQSYSDRLADYSKELEILKDLTLEEITYDYHKFRHLLNDIDYYVMITL